MIEPGNARFGWVGRVTHEAPLVFSHEYALASRDEGVTRKCFAKAEALTSVARYI